MYQPAHRAAPPSPPRRRRTTLAALAFALLVGTGSWLSYLNGQLDDVPRIDLHLADADRPRAAAADDGPVTVLLAGVDAGPGPSIADQVADDTWIPGSHRSDTIMVLHLSADRERAYLVSIPRDSWVRVPGHGMNKINAAFSLGGPRLYVRTVERLTGLRMDHLAVIDWAGFKDLTTALGGVRVYVPETVYDSSQHRTWTAGHHRLRGKDALAYVRMRHGLAGGDFDRIRRQQNFLRQTLRQTLSAGTVNNPVRLTRALTAVTGNLTVDESLTNAKIRSLALSLRSLDARDVRFVTIPTVCCPTIDGQSTIAVKRPQLRALMRAVQDENLRPYLRRYGRGDLLARPRDVS